MDMVVILERYSGFHKSLIPQNGGHGEFATDAADLPGALERGVGRARCSFLDA